MKAQDYVGKKVEVTYPKDVIPPLPKDKYGIVVAVVKEDRRYEYIVQFKRDWGFFSRGEMKLCK